MDELDELIAQQEEREKALTKKRDGITGRLARMGRGEDPASDEDVDSALDERNKVDEDLVKVRARLTSLRSTQADEQDKTQRQTEVRETETREPQRRAYDQVGRVTREERTYSREKDARGETSWFADMYRSQNFNDFRAQERLQRHGREVEVEFRSGNEQESRAVTTTGFAGLVTPQWLLDLAAEPLRSGRPAANAVQGLGLPAEGMTLNVPRGTTGASAAAQATQNTSLSNTDEVWADLSIPVVTVGGQQDVSRQSLERGMPGLDALVYLDLAGAYHAELDRQVVNGSGAGGEMLGIRLTAGINTATAFGAAPTAATFVSKTAGQIAAVAAAGTKVQPNIWLWHPRRWGWINSLSDTQGRPLVVPGVGGPMNVPALNSNPGAYSGDGDQTSTTTLESVGSMHGLPIFTDSNIPTNLGTPLEDVALVIDRRHSLLWEDGDGQPRQLRFEQTLGNQLTVKLVIYGYAAFTAGRYPVSVGRVGGADTVAAQGLVAPTF